MANEIKIKRYEAIITDTINRTITFEVENQLAKLAKVTYTKLSNDLSICKVYVDVLNREKTDKILEALQKVSGLFRSRVCETLDIYKTPKIIIELDKSIQYAENIDKIIESIKK